MCGPSSAMKNLNQKVQAFATQVQQQAGQVFGQDSTVFNNLMNSYGKLVAGGPNQQGFDQNTLNRLRSQVIEQTATGYKHAKAAVGNALSAIGGGNVPLPSGMAAQENADIASAAEGQKVSGLTGIDLKSADVGRENYFAGLKGEQEAPSVMNNAVEFNKEAGSALGQAQQSQKELDQSSNWWQPLLMKGIGAAASFATGGLSNLAKAGEATGGEQAGNFFSGGLSALTGGNN